MALFTQDTKVKSLRQAPFPSRGFLKKELTELARRSEDMELDAGTVLCREGEVGQEFFVILEGEVDVKRKGMARHAGRATSSVRSRCSRTSSAQPRSAAKTPLHVFVLTRPAQHLVNEHPAVERKVMRTLARRLAALSTDPAIS